MRSIEEIFAKANDASFADFFGTRVGDLVEWLPFDKAREWLKPESTEEDWTKAGFPRPRTDDEVIGQIKSYMPFAWEKANGCRGLSAGRSLCHMSAWLWLLGVDDAVEQLDEYSHYGKPQLRAICEAFGIDWHALDDGIWRNSEDDAGRPPLDGYKLKLPDQFAALNDVVEKPSPK